MFPDFRIDPPSVLNRVESVVTDICDGYLWQDLAVRLLTPGIRPLILVTHDVSDTDRGALVCGFCPRLTTD